jgi:hypothetical protein
MYGVPWYTPYRPSFIKIDSGIHKLMGEGGFTDRHRQNDGLLRLFLFFQNKESKVKLKAISITGSGDL